MENEYLKTTMVWIKKFEKKNTENIIDDLVIKKLWELIRRNIDTYEIREKYKQILNQINRYDNNYYSLICIILNVMVNRKDFLKLDENTINFKDLKFMKQRIAGEISTEINNQKSITKYTTKQVEYDYINYPEGIGKKSTEKRRKRLLKDAKIILSEEKLDLEKSKKWVKRYRKYIIMTYGRWSKQYEKYMNTAFEMQIILTSPNILLLAMRETMKKGIESAISELENKKCIKRREKNGI